MPKNITPIFVPSRAPELNPVENVRQYLRQNWLSNNVFENYDAIVDAACDAWRKLIAQPEQITSIGMPDWAHVVSPYVRWDDFAYGIGNVNIQPQLVSCVIDITSARRFCRHD